MLTCIEHILHFFSLLDYDYFLLYEHPSRNFHDLSDQEGNQFLLLYRSPVADIPFQIHIQTKLSQITHYRPHNICKCCNKITLFVERQLNCTLFRLFQGLQ